MNSMFQNCWNLLSIDLSNFKTDKVNNMNYKFSGCSNLKELNINDFKCNKKCIIGDIIEGIDKTKCKLIVKDEKFK